MDEPFNKIAAKQRRRLIRRAQYQTRKWAQEMPEQPKTKQSKKQKARASAEDKRLKINARAKTRHAMLAGKIVKQPCEHCGKDAIHSQAHHKDYSKHLEVTWLCKECHFELHFEEKTKAFTALCEQMVRNLCP